MKELEYKQEHLQKALALAKKGDLSIREIGRQFSIPSSTLFSKLSGRRAEAIHGLPRTILTPEEEEMFVEWLVEATKMSRGRTSYQLRTMVHDFLKQRGQRRVKVFPSGIPGINWLKAFKRRHEEVRLRHGGKTMVTKALLLSWFEAMINTIQDIAPGLLHDPQRIFNVSNCVLREHQNSVTCLACASAGNQTLTPLLIFPGKDSPDHCLKDFGDVLSGESLNGHIDGEFFLLWLKEVFAPQVGSLNKPVALFVDGTSSQCSLDVCIFCRENGILLYGLMSHSSHVTQPLDLLFFPTLQTHWKDSLAKFQEKDRRLSKKIFAGIFKEAWEKTRSFENVGAQCFKQTGIYPVDPCVVDWSKVAEDPRNPTTYAFETSEALKYIPNIPSTTAIHLENLPSASLLEKVDSSSPEEELMASCDVEESPSLLEVGNEIEVETSTVVGETVTVSCVNEKVRGVSAAATVAVSCGDENMKEATIATVESGASQGMKSVADREAWFGTDITQNIGSGNGSGEIPATATDTGCSIDVDRLLDLTAECMIEHGKAGLSLYKQKALSDTDMPVERGSLYERWKNVYLRVRSRELGGTKTTVAIVRKPQGEREVGHSSLVTIQGSRCRQEVVTNPSQARVEIGSKQESFSSGGIRSGERLQVQQKGRRDKKGLEGGKERAKRTKVAEKKKRDKEKVNIRGKLKKGSGLRKTEKRESHHDHVAKTKMKEGETRTVEKKRKKKTEQRSSQDSESNSDCQMSDLVDDSECEDNACSDSSSGSDEK